VKPLTSAWTELQHAHEARASGFEGRARVCARRAAGLAIREYLIAKYNSFRSNSLFDLIVDQTARDLLPPQLFDSLDRLSLKVNEQFQLPAGVDLISDAKFVITLLEAKLED
jgi:hypothetical protein